MQIPVSISARSVHVHQRVWQRIVSHHILRVCNRIIQIKNCMPPMLGHEYGLTWFLNEHLPILGTDVVVAQHARQVVREVLDRFTQFMADLVQLGRGHLFGVARVHAEPQLVPLEQRVPRRGGRRVVVQFSARSFGSDKQPVVGRAVAF